jgi:ubiquinone/menaquinone biosynthesis C-methylase UbiE
MEMNLSEEALIELARQLRNPSGENGVSTGIKMNNTNSNMINCTLETLKITDNETILEIGPGNGQHLSQLMSVAKNIQYYGVDVSETMITEAKKINAPFVALGKTSFLHSDGQLIPFPKNTFDKIFTVNTIYFWVNPNQYMAEIIRVLISGGTFSIAFVDKESMKKMPFSQHGFQLYDLERINTFLSQFKLSNKQIVRQKESVNGVDGSKTEREFIVLTVKKE